MKNIKLRLNTLYVLGSWNNDPLQARALDLAIELADADAEMMTYLRCSLRLLATRIETDIHLFVNPHTTGCELAYVCNGYSGNWELKQRAEELLRYEEPWDPTLFFPELRPVSLQELELEWFEAKRRGSR
jgi:hypothetical protein